MASSVGGPSPRIFLADAELILGLSRHLGAFATGPAKAALGELEFAGHVFEMAWRLRGSGLSGMKRVGAIALQAGITPRQLQREVLPALESLGWIEPHRDDDGKFVAVDEHVPPSAELINQADMVLDITGPTAVERAALVLIRETSRLPITKERALELATQETNEVAAKDALSALNAVRLVQTVRSDDGRTVAFNPHIWQGEAEIARAALRAEDANAQEHVGALLEELAQHSVMPQAHVTSTSFQWIDFAVALGLIQRTLVETTRGDAQAFLFSPHLGRDPFGVTLGDPSGHVRQLVGSMIYAATFAHYQLFSPTVFLKRLLRDGEAGDASPIRTDYTMLETAGIVKVAPAARYSKLVLLQADIAEEAIGYLEDRGEGPEGSTRGVTAQSSYIHLELERARLAEAAPATAEDTRRLIAALRETAGRRRFSGA